MKTVKVSEGGISGTVVDPKKIKEAGVLLEISVLDHKIVAHDAYYSFADEGTM